MKELIINNIEHKRRILLVEDEEVVEAYEEDENEKSIEGNIYIGKVQNILTGLQSAFIDIGEKKNAFIHVKDILPKVDVTKNEVVKEKNINEIIKPGDPIIVEVKKEPVDHKGPRVSTHISIVGRFIVFMPNANFITVSQKIENKIEKERLKAIVKQYLPEGTGAIIRTVAQGLKEEEIKKDVLNTIQKWQEITSKSVENIPQKIYSKGGILKKTIIDLVDSHLDRIVVSDISLKKEVESILKEIEATIQVEVKEHILQMYTIEKQLKALENRKVWLKCGGFITIDKTEALTAIDVNSGKYIGSQDLEKTVTQVNLEAASEIAKQLRLRDISGIIIVDFIDMQTQEAKNAVMQELILHTQKDRSKVQIEEFTKLNLMELTRKHINSQKNF